MSLRQAATASAKGGFVAGAASELYRDHVEGYEEYADEFVNAKNLNHANFIKKTITESEQRRAVISDIPWYAPSSLIAGFADPANTLFALPIAGKLGLLWLKN